MAFEITGRLTEKFDTQNVSDKFKKREFVIEYRDNPNSSFTEFIKFQLTQDRCSLADGFQVGQDVKIWFNLRGRKWEKDGVVNYFTNLEAWKMEAASAVAASAPSAAAALPDAPAFPADDSTNDLPF